jgi:hypothetical protein
MSEKFRIIHLKENPTNRRKARRRKSAKRAPRSGARRRRKTTSTAPRADRRRAFLVEGLQEKGRHVRFVYWTGSKFSAQRRSAKIFKSETEANKACRASMRRRHASYRLARVVSA